MADHQHAGLGLLPCPPTRNAGAHLNVAHWMASWVLEPNQASNASEMLFEVQSCVCADDRPGEFGRYVHMFMAKPVGGPDAAIKGFGAYMHEDGTYSAALQLERGFRPSAEADAMEAILSDALPQAPKASS